MGLYLVRRSLQSIPVLIGITLATFILIHLTPGDPARIILGFRATPESVAILRSQLGLDRPLPQQYVDFLGRAVQLDFGTSIIDQTPVGELLAPRAGATVFLTLYASVLSVLLAVPLGIASALRRNRSADHAIRLVTMVAFAMPPFWLGLLLILVFNIHLRWLPSSGYGTGVLGGLRSLTLPALTLGLGLAPLLVRTLRSSLIETMSAEFVEAAHARGLSRRRVLMKHVVRNSLVSTVTVLGVNLGILLGGVVVAENVFAIPGLGSMLVRAVVNRDFPVIQALALIFAVAVVLVNLLTDLLYVLIDPRVRL